MVLSRGKAQAGFTLVELLAVMAILGILAGLVAGTVVGLGSRSQSTRLDGDRDSISKSANSFSLEAFAGVYPVVAITSSVTGNVSGVQEIDFKAGLPQDPNKKFVPDFLTNLPDSSALVSWRIDTNSGNVFFAQDGSKLIKPSNNRLDIDAVTGDKDTNDDHVLELFMAKDEAAPEVIEISIPAGYTLGGGQAAEGTVVGTLQAVLDTDNPFDSGNKVYFGGVILTSVDSSGDPNPDEWNLVVDYNFNSSSKDVKTSTEAVRNHIIEVVRPSSGSGGTLTINFARGTDIEANESTETWTLTLLGTGTDTLTSSITIPSGTLDEDEDSLTNRTADASTGFQTGDSWAVSGATSLTIPNDTSGGSESLLKNPDTAAVYRWSAEEHSSIDPVVGETLFFNDLGGSQGVVIK